MNRQQGSRKVVTPPERPPRRRRTDESDHERLHLHLTTPHEAQHPTQHEAHAEKKAEEGEGPWLVSYADMMTLLMGFFALIASFSKPDIKNFEKVKKSAVEAFGGKYQEPYKDLETKLQEVVHAEHLEDKVKVIREADGVTIKFDGTIFFDSGAFVVKPEGSGVIVKITSALGNIRGFKAVIEGHTDDVPIAHPIVASNWELSAIRAARIAQIMESRGFDKSQLTIQGWGETHPEFPNTDQSGQPIPANQAKNRRVMLKVSNKD